MSKAIDDAEAERHRAKMAKRKVVQDAEVAEKTIEKGLLIVHTGQMEVAVEPSKDAGHYVRQLKAFRRRHRGLKGVFLIQDNDPSHTAGDTAEYWSGCGGWWRPQWRPWD